MHAPAVLSLLAGESYGGAPGARVWFAAAPEGEGYSSGVAYWGEGSQSWAVPYVAGVLASGWQVNPALDGETMRELLFQSARVNASGDHMIDPPAFIALVEETLV